MEKKRHILSCPGRQVGKREREEKKEREGKAKEGFLLLKKKWKNSFYTGLVLVQLAGTPGGGCSGQQEN